MKDILRILLLSLLFIGFTSIVFFGCSGADELRGEETAVLTDAPNVPPPIDRNYSTKVIVELEAVETVGRLTDGVAYNFWTFGGEVPGKFIRVREGDLVEFHLNNRPDSKMPHNIDLHAVTGPSGGGGASLTAPGKGTTFSFTAQNPGLFVYHCATAPVGMHVANGMYGMILVEPKEGLPPVDKEYYVMQGEFYTSGAYGDVGAQRFNMGKALRETPDYVVLNGSVGAISGDNALTAEVGETVRLFVGNGGPNLVSSFHVAGEIFDVVYEEGGTVANQQNVQSTLLPPGGSAIVEFKVDVPGSFILADHSIFRAFNKGALGVLTVHGEPNDRIFSGKQDEIVYLLEGGAVQEVPEEDMPVPAMSATDRYELGGRLYQANCAACHNTEGQGIEGTFPPLAASDFLNADHDRAISAVVHGLSGPIVVNGEEFIGVMPGVFLSDYHVANILSFVLDSWGNEGGEITQEDVARVRATR